MNNDQFTSEQSRHQLHIYMRFLTRSERETINQEIQKINEDGKLEAIVSNLANPFSGVNGLCVTPSLKTKITIYNKPNKVCSSENNPELVETTNKLLKAVTGPAIVYDFQELLYSRDVSISRGTPLYQ